MGKQCAQGGPTGAGTGGVVGESAVRLSAEGVADGGGLPVRILVGGGNADVGKACTTEAVDNLQHLEGAHLDALQQALWAKAMEGDLPAVAAIVRIIQARSRLYGVTGRGTNPRPPAPQTAVLSPEEVS